MSSKAMKIIFPYSLHHELFIKRLGEKDHHLGYIAVKYSMNDWSRLQGNHGGISKYLTGKKRK